MRQKVGLQEYGEHFSAHLKEIEEAQKRKELEKMWNNNTGAIIAAGIAGAVAGYYAVDAFRPNKYINDNGKIYGLS